MKKIIYISDLNLPNNSAQSIQILKMCDAFSGIKNRAVILFVKFYNKNYSLNKLKKNLILKNYFSILSILNIKKKIFLTNFLYSLLVSFAILKIKNRDIVYTRVILVSVFLSILKIHHTLEVHQELSGFTKKIFIFFYKFNKKNYLKIVFINKNLKKYFKILKNVPSIVLDDATNYLDFKKKVRTLNNSCAYSGSLTKGKGFDFIIKLAENIKHVDFHIYGEKRTYQGNLSKLKKIKNLKIHGAIDYKDIPVALKKNKILIMPYNKVSFGRSKNVNLSKYMSPLKLFDYLACERVIIASKLNVYNHILKNNHNSILINKLKINDWKKNIEFVLKNYIKFRSLRHNSLLTSREFTWKRRAKKIILFNEK